MRIAHEIKTRWINEVNREKPPKSEILLNGHPTGQQIAGAFLEAAVEWNGNYLLFLTEDCPFEEGLNIVMLDSSLKPLDRATLAVMYGTGCLTSLKLLEPDMVQFTFFRDTVWVVQLLPKVRPGLPIFGEESFMIWRPWSFLRRFVIHIDPETIKTRCTSVTTVIDIPPSIEPSPQITLSIASEINSIRLNKSNINSPQKSEIIQYGAPTGIVVDGSKLETALRWEACYLLFLSDSHLLESTLNIIMLDYALREVDRARLTSGGSLTSLKLVEPGIVQFTFYPDTIWTLQLLSTPRRGMPFFGEKPFQIWRPFSTWRYFSIHLDPAKIKTDVTSVQTIIDIDTKRVNDKHADEQT